MPPAWDGAEVLTGLTRRRGWGELSERAGGLEGRKGRERLEASGTMETPGRKSLKSRLSLPSLSSGFPPLREKGELDGPPFGVILFSS